VEPVVSFVRVVDGGDPEVQRVARRASFGVEIGGFEVTRSFVLSPMVPAERR